MKRFLIFTFVGPLIGVLVMSISLIWGIKELYSFYWMLRVSVSAASTFSFFILIMALLSWLCDILLIHWEVKLPVRMLTIGGGVVFLVVGLGRLGPDTVFIAGLCGAIAACCVWLSARPLRIETSS